MTRGWSLWKWSIKETKEERIEFEYQHFLTVSNELLNLSIEPQWLLVSEEDR